MNAMNPFQIPTCFQINQERRRKERIKKTVIAVVAASVLLLIGLLIEGCKTERATTSSRITPLGEVPAAAAEPQIAPAPVAQPAPAAVPAPTPSPVSKSNAMAPASQPAGLYTVKPGDTLTRIAKAHGTTVKGLKAANGLASDRIAVGAKLKLPEA